MTLNENKVCYWCSRTQEQIERAGDELRPQHIDDGHERVQHGWACTDCLPQPAHT